MTEKGESMTPLSFRGELEKMKDVEFAIVHQRSGAARVIYSVPEFGEDVVKVVASTPIDRETANQLATGILSPRFREEPKELLLAYSDIASLQIVKDIG